MKSVRRASLSLVFALLASGCAKMRHRQVRPQNGCAADSGQAERDLERLLSQREGLCLRLHGLDRRLNLKLSLNRANAVTNYLVAGGVTRGRLEPAASARSSL